MNFCQAPQYGHDLHANATMMDLPQVQDFFLVGTRNPPNPHTLSCRFPQPTSTTSTPLVPVHLSGARPGGNGKKCSSVVLQPCSWETKQTPKNEKLILKEVVDIELCIHICLYVNTCVFYICIDIERPPQLMINKQVFETWISFGSDLHGEMQLQNTARLVFPHQQPPNLGKLLDQHSLCLT